MAATDYREWAPSPDLAADVACLWRGHVGTFSVPYTDRVLPDGCVDLIWDGTTLFVAGPDTGPVLLAVRPPRTFVGIRMQIGRAELLAGRPAFEIRDLRVELRDLWDRPELDELADRVAAAAAGSPKIADVAVAGALEHAVRNRLVSTPSRDRLVCGVVARLRAERSRSPGTVAHLAAELGVTERSLHRRCIAAVGYGPKMLDRVLRFRRARSLARRSSIDLVDLAVAAGYADQSHMTRECRRLSGQTPSESFKTFRPGRITVQS